MDDAKQVARQAEQVAAMLKDSALRRALLELGWRVESQPVPAREPDHEAEAEADEPMPLFPALLSAVGKRKRRLKAYLVVADCQQEGDTLTLTFEPDYRHQKEQVEKPENLALIQELAGAIAGRPVTVECLLVDRMGGRITHAEEEILDLFDGRLA